MGFQWQDLRSKEIGGLPGLSSASNCQLRFLGMGLETKCWRKCWRETGKLLRAIGLGLRDSLPRLRDRFSGPFFRLEGSAPLDRSSRGRDVRLGRGSSQA